LTLDRLGPATLEVLDLDALRLGRLTPGALKLRGLGDGALDENDPPRPADLTAARTLEDRLDEDPPFSFLPAATAGNAAARPSTTARTANRRTAMSLGTPLVFEDTVFSFTSR
jgi:hypothetical protein